MVRFERDGQPCYIVASLLEMSDFGGTGTEACYEGIISLFFFPSHFLFKKSTFIFTHLFFKYFVRFFKNFLKSLFLRNILE